MLRLKSMLLVGMLALLAAGCQLQLAMDVAIARDGSGVVELAVGLDRELLELLTEAGFDPAIGLEEVAARAPRWQFEDRSGEGGLTYVFSADFDDPTDFERLMDEFEDGVGPGDPRLFEGLGIEVAEDGSIVFAGQAGLLLPETTGIEGADVDFDADDLDALLVERGDEFVRNELRVSLPTAPVEHTADVRDGNTLTWQLPVGELRPVEARSEPVPDRTPLLAAIAGSLALAAAALATIWRRRRRRRVRN